MTDLRRYGLVIFRDVPASEKGLLDLVELHGWSTETTYHPTDIFTIMVRSERVAINYAAYGGALLPSHLDATYYGSPPKIEYFLGVKYAAPQGDTVSCYTDMMKIVEDLRQENPEAYQMLTKTKTRQGRLRLGVEEECDPERVRVYEFATDWEGPPIIMDEKKGVLKTARIPKIANSAAYRLGENSDEDMEKYYKACSEFVRRANDPKYQQQLVVKEGILVVCDNHRVTHDGTINILVEHLWQMCSSKFLSFWYLQQLLRANSRDQEVADCSFLMSPIGLYIESFPFVAS